MSDTGEGAEGALTIDARPRGHQSRPDAGLRADAGSRAMIHIGLHKTGSSTIQAWLRLNRTELAEQDVALNLMRSERLGQIHAYHGFLAVSYARTGRWRHDRTFRARYGIDGRAAMEALVEEFSGRAEKSFAQSGRRLQVFSSEQLGGRLKRTDEIAALDDWLCERLGRVEYAIYLRDQPDWLASSYAERVTHGGTMSLAAFLGAPPRMDYDAMVRAWEDVVGPQRLHVRLLEPDALVGGDLVDDFAAVLGVDASRTRRPGRANEALPALRLGALRRANQAARALQRVGLPVARSRLLRLTAPFDRGGKLRLTGEQALAVARATRDSNEALRARRFPERRTLFTRSGQLLGLPAPIEPDKVP